MENTRDRILASMTKTGTPFYLFLAITIALMGWGGYAWWTQIDHGLMTTGLDDTIMWGLYISNFVFCIGISHAGILISATVRLMNLEKYKPVARMAEVLTIAGLAMAVLSVVVDLGRPDRILVLLMNIRPVSPLAWDLIFITLYFTFSAFYLFVSLKEDIMHLTEMEGGRGALYRFLMKIYGVISPKDAQKYQKMLWWIALIILPFPVFGSGMVVPFIFSMLVARPAWNVPFFGPYFLTGAIVSGVSAVTVIAVALRKIFKWEDILSSELIVGLGNIIRIGVPIYIYFTLVEHFTIQYVQEHADLAVSNYVLRGPYAIYFWGMIIIGFIVPMLILFYPKTKNVTGVFVASALVTAALWLKRIIIVVPALVFPNIPYETGVYIPTWVEWALVAGVFGLGGFIYAIFVKLFPIVELEAAH